MSLGYSGLRNRGSNLSDPAAAPPAEAAKTNAEEEVPGIISAMMGLEKASLGNNPSQITTTSTPELEPSAKSSNQIISLD